MSDFLKRHKLLTNVIKSIVFLSLLAALGAVAVTSYFNTQSARIATLDSNSTAGVSKAIQAGIPVFIEACRPLCTEQLPEVEAAALELAGRVEFFQIDPEAQPELMGQLSQIVGQPILSYPAHILLAENPAVLTGAKTARQLVDFIVQSANLQPPSQATNVPSTSNSTASPAVTYQNITVVNEQNLQQEMAGVTLPVYVFLCEGHECEIQAEALDAVAGRFAGRLKFIQINWYENPNITVRLVRGAQMPLAFPIHVILSPDGAILNYAVSVLQEDQIEGFISDAMANAAAMAAGGGINAPATVTPAAATSTPLPVTPAATRTAVPGGFIPGGR